ncbi:MAG: hypothetical protein JRJ68_03055 [Deltaproteobacteria bacterium]|nr:hypothetical protein [Deltaproteobacteria bacterium]
MLTRLPFTGNLRELQSIAARIACLCSKKMVNDDDYLGVLFQSCCHTSMDMAEDQSVAEKPFFDCNSSLSSSMKAAEKSILQLSKESCAGSIKCMSDQLGVGRTTLWRKLKEHSIN